MCKEIFQQHHAFYVIRIFIINRVHRVKFNIHNIAYFFGTVIDIQGNNIVPVRHQGGHFSVAQNKDAFHNVLFYFLYGTAFGTLLYDSLNFFLRYTAVRGLFDGKQSDEQVSGKG